MSASTTRSRVFVSSVIQGLESFRAAARQGIEAVGGEPVLVNEDFPSLATSSRNACLDAIDSCDHFLIVVGERGGWTAPSGKLVVEEEYEHALSRRLPVFAFLQDTKRDADAERLARTLSDFVDGAFRRTFSTPDELQREIERALRTHLAGTPRRKTMPRSTDDYFAKPYDVQFTTMLRFVLVPDRDEEVIDPVTMGSEEFKRRLQEIAHSQGVGLLSYERPKSTQLVKSSLVITQTEANGRHGEGEHVRLELTEAGELIIDANVSGRRKRDLRHDTLGSMVVAIEDIETVLKLCFQFAMAFYDDRDPYKRHQGFGYNVGLTGLDHRTLERNPQPRQSYTMSMRNRNAVILAYDSLRPIHRRDLDRPEAEIARTVEMLTRKARE
jgi:uncharacterized protein DUF4062